MSEDALTTDGFEELEDWATTMLASMAPRQRVPLLRGVGRSLRRANAKRITRQVGPDGKRWAARKKRRNPRQRAKMLLGLRKARHMKVSANASGVSVGFEGRTARIAAIHHHGLRDRLKGSNGKAGPLVRFSQRKLLGLPPADREAIQTQLLDHFDAERRI